ncbi:MAG: alpha/beta hydrolase [Chitinophagaceae bacterium]
MQDIYFISGLGADQRLFQYLNLSNITPHFIRWITPLKDESWESYANRLLEQIPAKNPVIIGMSMGGMMAIEISKLISTNKIILISSAKSKKEIPPYFRLLRVFQGHKWLPYKFLVRLGLIFGGWLFGTTCKADKQLLNEIIYDTDETLFRWSWHRVAYWKNEFVPDNVFHIHGNHDHMLPVYFIKPNHIIHGGTHLMVINKAEEISEILNKILSDNSKEK